MRGRSKRGLRNPDAVQQACWGVAVRGRSRARNQGACERRARGQLKKFPRTAPKLAMKPGVSSRQAVCALRPTSGLRELDENEATTQKT